MFLFVGLILTYFKDSDDIMKVFTVVSTVSNIGFIFVWSMILLAYVKYRKTRPDLHAQSVYKMPGGVPMAWTCLAFLLFSMYLFTRDADTLQGMLFTPLWFGFLSVIYLVKYRKTVK